MGVAEFQLLKNNLIEIMKIETEKIPTQNEKKPWIQKKIHDINRTIGKEQKIFRKTENTIPILEKTIPKTEIEINQLKEKLNEKRIRDLKEIGGVPPKKLKHHIIVGLIGGLFFTVSTPSQTNLEIILITLVFSLPGYVLMLFFWYIWVIFVELVVVLLDEEGDSLNTKAGGVNVAEVILVDWPPYHITRRTRAAYERAYEARGLIQKLEERYEKDIQDLDNSSIDGLRKRITKSKKDLKKAEEKISKNMKDLEKANEELNDLETYVNTLEIKKKELLDSVAYLIPFSSELS